MRKLTVEITPKLDSFSVPEKISEKIESVKKDFF